MLQVTATREVEAGGVWTVVRLDCAREAAPVHLHTLGLQEAMSSTRLIVCEVGCAHAWLIRLAATDIELMQCSDLLSDSERSRARRFHRRADGDHYIVAHGLLRHILSQYCATRPTDLQFATGETANHVFGRSTGPSIAFNLSHASGRMLLAITGEAAVGVDIEAVDYRIDRSSLRDATFSAANSRTSRDDGKQSG